MAFKDEISTAIGAHGLWKGKLREPIRSGSMDADPRTVRLDDRCKFGQWLHGAAIPRATNASPAYRECLDLHARFHAAAAQVLELALAGKTREAEAAVAAGSPTLSHKLTDAMMRWQKAAEPEPAART